MKHFGNSMGMGFFLQFVNDDFAVSRIECLTDNLLVEQKNIEN